MKNELSKEDLVNLGITPGPIFSKIFRHTAGLPREVALQTAKQIASGEWTAPRNNNHIVKPGSFLEWLISFPLKFCIDRSNLSEPSRTECRRIVEQGALSVNFSNEWKCDDPAPRSIIELTWFPNSDSPLVMHCEVCDAEPCEFHKAMWDRESCAIEARKAVPKEHKSRIETAGVSSLCLGMREACRILQSVQNDDAAKFLKEWL